MKNINYIRMMIKNLKLLDKQVPKKLNGYKGGIYKLVNGIVIVYYSGHEAIIQSYINKRSLIFSLKNREQKISRQSIICEIVYDSIKDVHYN